MMFCQKLSWKNIGKQPVVAFEISILKYDPFDEPLIGSRWVVNGKDSADWQPLAPGKSGQDETRSSGYEYAAEWSRLNMPTCHFCWN
jgi:hypothetical protein